jgi:hypothetical protein
MALQAARGAFALAKLAGGASLAALAMAPAFAQDAAPASTEEDAIVVTGIRGSLQRAAEVKRDAPQVLDVITAEDVGKLPDPMSPKRSSASPACRSPACSAKARRCRCAACNRCASKSTGGPCSAGRRGCRRPRTTSSGARRGWIRCRRACSAGSRCGSRRSPARSRAGWRLRQPRHAQAVRLQGHQDLGERPGDVFGE